MCGIPEKIIRLIKMTLHDNTSKVLIANTSSRSFYVSLGVRHRDALDMLLEGTAQKKETLLIKPNQSVCSLMILL